MNAVTLVPLRLGEDQHRHWLWDHTLPALEGLGLPIYTGDSTGEWARAAALNNASAAAGDWEVALLADGDTIPDPDAIRRAIMWVQDTKGAARPHYDRYMLTQDGTLEFLRRGPDGLHPQHYDKQFQGGGLLVVHRECWEAVGGFDERLVGWGREDSVFNMRALRRSRWDRLPGECWHLHHPRHKGGANRQSEMIYQRMIRGYSKDIEAWARNQRLPSPQEIF